MQYTACLVVTRSLGAQVLQDQFVILRKAAFYAGYGDIFAEICTKLKTQAEAKKKVDGCQMLQKQYWTEIGAKLRREEDAYDRVLAGERVHDECPTYLAVLHACNHVGLNLDDVIQVIRLYSERNQVVHTNIIPLIKNGFFFDLAEQVYHGCCDSPLLISADDQKLIELLQHLIEAIIHLWFDHDETEPDNYQMWTSAKELRDRYKQLRGYSSAESTVQKDINAEIVEKVRKRLREVEQENEIVGRLSRNFDLLSGEKKVKGVASSQLGVECERAKRRKGDWTNVGRVIGRRL